VGQTPRELTPDVSARHAFGAALRRWRTSRGLSQDELGRLVLHSGDTISKVEKAARWPTPELVARCEQVLDAGGALAALWPAVQAEQAAARSVGRPQFTSSPGLRAGEGDKVRGSVDLNRPDDAVYRRQLLGSGGALLAGLATNGSAAFALTRLIENLTAYEHATAIDRGVTVNPSVQSMARAVARAKIRYQASRYDEVLRLLPDLLDGLDAARSRFAGEDLTKVYRLQAGAYHVVGSVLLKMNDPALAAMAADRSMRAARHSGDAATVGSSARILTHTLVNAGHPDRGQAFAAQAADRLLAGAPREPETFAVYGALVLRGAVAAAHADKKDEADAMLDAAGDAARHVRDGGNLRWTGFDATNVLLHRLNVALAFADPGRALAVAGKVDVGKVKLAERKASLHLDVAQANALCQRWEASLAALRAAEVVAPQELRTRPAAKRLTLQLAARAPRTVQSEVADLARRCGIVL
jgi:transcriptional regulator with XRE-family HTH domain